MNLTPHAVSPSSAAVILSANRRAVMHAAGAFDSLPDSAFERLTTLAVRVLRVRVALVAVADGAGTLVLRHPGAGSSFASGLRTTQACALCERVFASGVPLVIADTHAQSMIAGGEGAGDEDVATFAGVPLLASNGEILGSFCVIDSAPREWTDEEMDTLRDLAAAAVNEVELRITAHTLADQHARQSALLDHTTEMICATDLKGRIIYVNVAWQEAMGYTLDEARHIRPVDFVAGAFRHSYRAAAIALASGDTTPFEAVLLAKDGRRIVCAGQGWPLREHGKVIGTCAVYRDVTEQYRSEHVRERLVNTLEASPDFVSISTTDGQMVFLNRAARDLVGLAEDVDASTVELRSLRSPETSQRLVDELIPIAIRDGMWRGESTLVDGAGVRIPVSQTIIAHPSPNADMPPYFISIVAQDLRERVRAEEDRHKGEERLRAAMEASMDGFFIMASIRDAAGAIRDFCVEDVNQRACDMMARERSTLVGQMARDLWPSARLHFHELVQVAETGIVLEREIAVTAAGMLASWVQVQVVKVGDGIGATTRDITSRKLAEATRERERAFYAAMLEHLSEGIVGCDATGEITLYNRATREFHGLGEFVAGTDPIGSSGTLFEVDGVTPIVPASTPLMCALRGEFVLNREIVVSRTHEPPRTLLVNGRQFFDSDGRLLGAVVASRDVTTQKVVERALRDSEERFRSVLESLGEGVIITDLGGITTYANARMRDITGFDPCELVGRDPAGLLLKQDDRRIFSDRLAEHRKGHGGRYTVEHVRKDGSTVWVEIAGFPYRDGAGKIVGTVSSVIDISDRREWESRLLEAKDEAERANRAKSAILSRASHELRTPLNSVIGFSGVLLKNRLGTLNDAELSYIQRIRANGSHLLSLVNDILDIAKVESGHMSVELSTVAIDELVRDVLSALEGRVIDKKSLALVCFAPDALEPILTDSGKLRQVLINLVDNAIKFTKEGAVMVRIVGDETNHPVSIIVEDTGCGIAPEELGTIFDAFEQAESANTVDEPGTGLGLSIAKSFCDLLGHGLHVESDLGRGTQFIIDL